ncbi:MAG TPA: phosphoribosyltransferase family protein, partial [Thermoanaerobaculia bacterium]|nr:phosphoribosyltransferase family protein [Thermoanaerobaculia bacterium]
MTPQTLVSREDIQKRVAEMGREISKDLIGQEVILLCVLKGAVFFAADLARAMSMDIALDFIQVSSYGNAKQSSGVVT